jgi:hypothetical protein
MCISHAYFVKKIGTLRVFFLFVENLFKTSLYKGEFFKSSCRKHQQPVGTNLQDKGKGFLVPCAQIPRLMTVARQNEARPSFCQMRKDLP